MDDDVMFFAGLALVADALRPWLLPSASILGGALLLALVVGG